MCRKSDYLAGSEWELVINWWVVPSLFLHSTNLRNHLVQWRKFVRVPARKYRLLPRNSGSSPSTPAEVTDLWSIKREQLRCPTQWHSCLSTVRRGFGGSVQGVVAIVRDVFVFPCRLGEQNWLLHPITYSKFLKLFGGNHGTLFV